MSLKHALAAALVAGAVAQEVQAGPITLTVNGTIGATTDLLTGNAGVIAPTHFVAGNSVSFTMVFDDSLNGDTDSATGSGFFEPGISSSLQSGSVNFSANGGSIWQQDLGATTEQLFLSNGTVFNGVPSGINFLYFQFLGQDSTDLGDIFNDADILTSGAANFTSGMSQADSRQAYIDVYSGSAVERVAIDGLTWQFNGQTSPVPEPSTLALLGGALGALALTRRRRDPQGAEQAPSAPAA